SLPFLAIVSLPLEPSHPIPERFPESLAERHSRTTLGVKLDSDGWPDGQSPPGVKRSHFRQNCLASFERYANEPFFSHDLVITFPLAVRRGPCVRAVGSTEPSSLRAARIRRSATGAAERNAEAASVLRFDHSRALFPDGVVFLSSRIRSDKRQLAGNKVGDAILRRRHHAEHCAIENRHRAQG